MKVFIPLEKQSSRVAAKTEKVSNNKGRVDMSRQNRDRSTRHKSTENTEGMNRKNIQYGEILNKDQGVRGKT